MSGGNANGFNRDSLLREIWAEVRKVGPELGKFLDMAASFEDDIPEEYKRYRAALKALKKTSGIEQYDVLKAADHQLAKLSEREKMMSDSLGGRRTEIRQIAERAAEIDTRMGELKKQLGELEKERNLISDRHAAKDREVRTIEDSYRAVAAEVEKEINSIKTKVMRFLSEDYKPEPMTASSFDEEAGFEPQKSAFFPDAKGAEKGDNGFLVNPAFEGLEADAEPAEQKSESKAKTCPSCGGRLDWYSMMKMWKCYTCGYEEKVRK